MIDKNLTYLRKSLGLKQSEMLDNIGIRSSKWSDYERGKATPPIELLVKISDFFRVELRSLVTTDLEEGNLNKIKENEFLPKKGNLIGNLKGNLIDNEKQSVQVLQQVEDMVQIPITDISVAAGTGVFNSDYMENVAHFSFPNHLLKRGATYLSVRIRGASMAPTLQDGGYMAIRLIERTEWANIADERVFVVCDTEGKSYLKRIKNRFKKGFIVLMSDSPDKASYPNFNLQADEIQSIWEAEFYISAKMPNIHSQYYSRLAQLEDKVDDLLKLLPKIEQ